jgi:hypothetical protein
LQKSIRIQKNREKIRNVNAFNSRNTPAAEEGRCQEGGAIHPNSGSGQSPLGRRALLPPPFLFLIILVHIYLPHRQLGLPGIPKVVSATSATATATATTTATATATATATTAAKEAPPTPPTSIIEDEINP